MSYLIPAIILSGCIVFAVSWLYGKKSTIKHRIPFSIFLAYILVIFRVVFLCREPGSRKTISLVLFETWGHAEPWKVTVVDTGLNTQTGGRVKRVRDYIGNEPFMLTYGDAVGDVNITELVNFHKAHGKIGTMSMYNFGQNKGVVEVGANGVIDAFREKSDMDGNLINIGFMVFQPELFDLIEGDSTVFEKGPLTKLVEQKELVGYIHKGFWQCMDTLREKQKLEQLWEAGNAPWKVWKE